MKKKLALILTLATLLTSGSAYALELESVESTTEATVTAPVEAETTAEAELQALTITPGKNLLTGETSLITFDSESDLGIYSDHHNFNTMTIVEAPEAYNGAAIDADGSKGKMVKFHRDANPSGHWAGYAYKGVVFDGDRKYWFTWDEYWDMEGVSTLWGVFTNFYAKDHWDLGMSAKNHGNAWRRYDYVNTPAAGKNLYMQSKSSNVEVKNDQSQPTVPTNLYIDNIGVYPYYKVTYVLDDAPVKAEQFLFKPGTTKNSVDAIATEFTPDKSLLPKAFSKNGYVYKPLGWATTENATEPEETIALTGQDLVLFPVYDVEQRLTISSPVISCAKGTSATVSAIQTTASGATFSQFTGWDFALTGATSDWEAGDTSFDIFADGKAGVVTVKALFSDGVECSISVQFIGDTMWRPGYNIFTGTQKPFDFESITGEQLASLFEGKPSDILVDNTNKSGVNYSNKAMILTGGTYPARFLNYFKAPIPNNRPLYVSYDYYGSFGNHWLMKNSSASTDYCMRYLTSLGYTSSSTWKHLQIDKLLSTAKNTADVQRIGFEIEKASGTDGTIYYDNINIVPYYEINYYTADGQTLLNTDYALLDENGDFLKKYAPKPSLANAAAVSTSPNGKRAITIDLGGSDLNLYALPEAPLSFFVTDEYGTTTQVDVMLKDMDSYTVSLPQDMGFRSSVENFVAWADEAGNLIFPGDILRAADFDKYKGNIYTPYCCDLTKPATGFAFEAGQNQKINTGDKVVYKEYIEDEGRDVFHMHQYASTFDSGRGQWMHDARAHFRFDNGMPSFKAEEYNIVQYAYKVSNAAKVDVNTLKPEDVKPENIVALPDAEAILYYYTEPSNNGYFSNGEHRVSGKPIKILCDNKYHVFECDMSIPSNGSGVAWTEGVQKEIWGFAIDPAKVTYSADMYIDYIRVYRDGLLTVTYDTNSPIGNDNVKYNVPADTGRGGGTNYYLKGDMPVLEGDEAKDWVFKGWSLSKDDADNGIVTDIIPLLSRHTTVYACWQFIDGVPGVSNNISVRSDYAKGVRFSSTITADSRDLANEYGYLIAREDVLNSEGKELTFNFNSNTETVTKEDGTKAPKPLYIKGVAYDKQTGVDYQYANNNGEITFTAVCINVPEEHYATRLVARTYMKYDINGNAFTLYGTSNTTSLKEAAQAVKDAGGQNYEENRAYVDEILSK